MAVDRERLADRLAAVERRLTDADPDEGGLADVAAVEGRLSELEARADDLDARLGEVESGLQALRGYVGGVDAVDEAVERRADAALAKAEELEALLVDEPGLTVERVPTERDGDGNGEAGADGDADDRRVERAALCEHEGDPVAGTTHGSAGAPEPGGPPDGTDAGPFDAGDGRGSPDGTDAGPGGEGRRLVDRLRDAL